MCASVSRMIWRRSPRRGRAMGGQSGLDQGTDAFVGENFQQHRVLHAPVDDVRGLDAAADGVERIIDLGQHAAVDGAIGDKVLDLRDGQTREQLAFLVQHAGGVGEQHELLGLERDRELAGHNVGVDVVGLAVLAHADGRDHRNEIAGVEQRYQSRINAADLAHMADVNDLAREIFFVGSLLQHHFLGADQPAVLAGKPHGLAALLADEIDDLLVDEAAQHHLNHLQVLAVGATHDLNKLALLPDSIQQLADLRPAAVNHHGIHADELHQYHVEREAALKVLVHHGVAAVLDDDGFALETLDVRQRLGQDARPVGGGLGGERHSCSFSLLVPFPAPSPLTLSRYRGRGGVGGKPAYLIEKLAHIHIKVSREFNY